MLFLLFPENHVLSSIKNRKLCYRLYQRPIFTVLRPYQNETKKNVIFWKNAFYHVNIHFSSASDSQNLKKSQILRVWLRTTKIWTQNGPKMDPKWVDNGSEMVSKLAENGSNVWQVIHTKSYISLFEFTRAQRHLWIIFATKCNNSLTSNSAHFEFNSLWIRFSSSSALFEVASLRIRLTLHSSSKSAQRRSAASVTIC